jgi:hypothetical protein
VSEPRRQSRTPWYFAGAVVVVAAVVVIALLVSGGDSDDSSSTPANGGTEATLPPQVVRTSEIEAQDAGSPQRALLEWWQSFQFGDAQGVVSRTTKATLDEIGAAQLRELVNLRGQGFQGVEVLGASVAGDTASVRAGLLTFQPKKKGAPPPDTPTASRPTTVVMKKEDDEWRFAETELLAPMIAGLRARKQQKKQGGQQQQQTNTETTPE